MGKTSDKLVLTDKDGLILSKVTTENDALTLIHVADLYLQDECEPLVFEDIWEANRVRTSSAYKILKIDDLEVVELFLNFQITKLKKVFKKNPHLSKPDLKAYFERISTDHPVMRGGEGRATEVERGRAPIMPLSEDASENAVEPPRSVPERSRGRSAKPAVPIAPEPSPEPVHRPLTEVEQAQASILSRALGSDPDLDF